MTTRITTTLILIIAISVVKNLEGRPSKIVNSTVPSSVEIIFNSTTKNEKKQYIVYPKPNTTRVRILTHPGIHHRKGSVDEYLSGDQDIIFPDDSIELNRDPIRKLEATPKCAGGLTFCEDIEGYPYNHLRDVLRRSMVTTELFDMDETADEIANRIDDSEDNYICGAVARTIYPKVGQTKSKKWKFIINQGVDEGHIQGVRVETCRSLNRPCDIISLPDGYTTSCKQKFVYRRLLSISDGGQPVPDTFLMPSACCCSYRREIDFLARFGRPVTPKPKNDER